MPNNNAQEFDRLRTKYRNFQRTIPQKAAITMVNFFKRNFKVGGFVDVPFQRWKKSTYPGARATMVRSGNTRREIKKIQVSQSRVTVGIGNHNHYAKIHNEGGKILITPKIRRFFWAKYKETGKEYWMWLALTKKTHIEIPQRKFIGDSKALEKTLDRMIVSELKKALL
ncbi:hypothetical protein IW15_10095 [Chryseobacterium soli]|uniref:Phage virion morphogenesis family protein n=1 Tax=Chryseobacterium soli TaxID=445961 RepID=A0A086A8U1_9FLAO|nr:phage virion morphogenesis protein [Chryseobacterium soli]KFF13105.1 hypothetical protein IW15_10095 [Chryseobacterium soli]